MRIAIILAASALLSVAACSHDTEYGNSSTGYHAQPQPTKHQIP